VLTVSRTVEVHSQKMIKNVNEAVIYSATIPRDPLYFFFSFYTFLMEN
jgi:hypothetical protein